MKQVFITFCVCTTLVTFGVTGYLTYKSLEQATASGRDGEISIKRSFCQTREGIESLDHLFRELFKD